VIQLVNEYSLAWMTYSFDIL